MKQLYLFVVLTMFLPLASFGFPPSNIKIYYRLADGNIQETTDISVVNWLKSQVEPSSQISFSSFESVEFANREGEVFIIAKSENKKNAFLLSVSKAKDAIGNDIFILEEHKAYVFYACQQSGAIASNNLLESDCTKISSMKDTYWFERLQ